METRKDVDRLIKDLGRPDSTARMKAAEALGQIGEPAVEPLIQALKHRGYREKVAEILGQIGEPAVEPLIQALADRRFRSGAALALGRIGDARAVEPLIEALENRLPAVRQRVAEALGQIGEPAVEPLIQALGDTLVGSAAASILGMIGDARAVDPLIEALTFGLHSTCGFRAREALTRIGEPAVEPLIRALRDEDRSVRSGAQDALGDIGDARAIEPLVQSLKDPSRRNPGTADALDKLGWNPPDDTEKAYYLLAQLSRYSYKDIGKATEELVELGKPAVEPLIQAFTDARQVELLDKDRGIKGVRTFRAPFGQLAVLALTMIGEPAVEPLIEALEDWPFRAGAALALASIGDARAIEPLIQALKDVDVSVRIAAAAGLGNIGDARAVEPLTQALQDKDGQVRQIAKNALKSIRRKKVRPGY